MHAADEFPFSPENLQHRVAYPRHDMHASHDVGRVSDLYSDLGNRRPDWTHAVRNYVHRAPNHAAGIKSTQRVLHFLGIFPVIGWSSILEVLRADERPIFQPGDVGGIRTDQNAVGPLSRIQRDGNSA